MIYLTNPNRFGANKQIVHICEGYVAKIRSLLDLNLPTNDPTQKLTHERLIQSALHGIKNPAIRVPKSIGIERLTIDSQPYVGHVMEFLPSQPLSLIEDEKLYTKSRSEYERVLELTRQYGFVPRDNHAANCLVMNNGEIVLVDFEAWLKN